MGEEECREALRNSYGVVEHMGQFLIAAFEARRMTTEQVQETATGMIRMFRHWERTRYEL